ncbi:MAG: hypothetical protein O3B86_02425 [Planctomycetota bacterium]|nr:hypothetical protein [Planctomycetota bacterium]
MFRPFTGMHETTAIEIRRAINRIGSDGFGRAFQESISDLERLWNEDDNRIEPEVCIERLAQAMEAFSRRPLLDHREELVKAWLRAAYRKWHLRNCDEDWEQVLESLRTHAGDCPDIEEVRDLRRRLETDEIGAYHILFPTAGNDAEETGRLASANVRVLRKQDKSEPSLSVAPWSFFAWLPDDARHLSEVLPNALANAGIPAAEIDEWRFLIELSPVQNDTPDCPWNLAAATDVLEQLVPADVSILGRSLELAVAIAAWAAHNQLSVPPLVATGELTNNGGVSNVGGIGPKVRAIVALQRVVPHLNMIFPAGNRHDVITAFEGAGLPDDCFVTSLKDAFSTGLLADGFDSYRATAGGVPAPPVESGRDSKVLNETDLQPLRDLITNLTPYRKVDKAQPQVVVLPFDRSSQDGITPRDRSNRDDITPEAVSTWFADQFLLEVQKEKVGDRSNFQVPIAVSMSDLFPDDSEIDVSHRNWNDVLARLVNSHIRATGIATSFVDAEAVAIALRQPFKVVLVVYDERSIKLWKRMADEKCFAVYQQQIKALKRFAESDPNRTHRGCDWAPQSVIAVCSDYRHSMIWRDV